MKKLLLLLIGMFLAISTNAQKFEHHFAGRHYGGHEYDWKNYNRTTYNKKGDTLYLERLVMFREKARQHMNPAEFQRIKMLLKHENEVQVLYDSLSYTWSNGPKFFKTKVGDSLKVVFDDPRRVNYTYEEGKEYLVNSSEPLVFTSFAAVELYLMYTSLNLNFSKDIYIADKELRSFRVRVLGETKIGVHNQLGVVDCYEIALYALDESSMFNAKMYLGKNGEGFLKKENIVNELHEGKRHRSVYNEFRIDEDSILD